MVFSIVLALFSAVIAFGQTQTTRPDSSPATQPSRFRHEEGVKQAGIEPLLKEEYRSKAGKPLANEQISDVEKANKAMESAVSSRAGGDYSAAADASGKALATYKQLLGDANYHTISAKILSETMAQMKSASPEDQKNFAEADKLQAQAEAAHEKGRYADAMKAARQVLQIREGLLGKDHAEVGAALRILGNAQIELGKPVDAAESLDRALKITEDAYGPDHPQTALVLDRIGWLRVNQGKTDDAIAALARAARTFRNTVGETQELAETLDNLGTVLIYKRDPERALGSKLRAYVIREKLLGPEARDTAVSLSNLAWLYSETRLVDPDEILALRKKALVIFEKTLGPDHPWTVLERGNLARDYATAGKYDDALTLYQQLVSQDEAHPDQLSDRVIDRETSLGGLLLTMGRMEDGLRILDKATQLCKTLQAKGDVQPAINALESLANLYQSWRMFEDAAKAAELVRAWAAKVDPKPDETAMNRLFRLGTLYKELGRLDDAKRTLEEAVRVSDTLKGDDAVKGVNPLLSLSSVYEKLGQLQEAERTCEQALRLTESKLVRGSRGQAYALMTMGRIQVKQKRVDLGKFSLEESRKIFEKEENRRSDPSGLVLILQESAAGRLADGDRAQAVELYRQAVSQSREVAERVKNVNAKAMLANALRQLLVALPNESPAEKKEYDSLKAELKQLLEELRKGHALNAENEQWLKDLGQ
jgi:tetratricopeptide (TPR) repeat protein